MLPRYGNLVDMATFPRIASWAEAMSRLPHHDAAFASVAALGDLNTVTPPVLQRLAPASKAGFKAIEEAALTAMPVS